jgi:WXXGXW repeat (2 copies)
MQKFLSRIAILSVIVMAVSFSASAQVYVRVRPVAPVIVRPVAPSPAHVWIDEEWEPRGGKYVYAGGHWAAPPHPGWMWVSGHWRRHGPEGEQWVRGHWRRR